MMSQIVFVMTFLFGQWGLCKQTTTLSINFLQPPGSVIICCVQSAQISGCNKSSHAVMAHACSKQFFLFNQAKKTTSPRVLLSSFIITKKSLETQILQKSMSWQIIHPLCMQPSKTSANLSSHSAIATPLIGPKRSSSFSKIFDSSNAPKRKFYPSRVHWNHSNAVILVQERQNTGECIEPSTTIHFLCPWLFLPLVDSLSNE